MIKYKSKDGIVNSIGQITYYLDKRKKTLNRREADYSDVFRKKPGSTQVLSENISSLKFKYYVYDEQRKKYSWVTSWQESDETFGIQIEEHVPLVVSIEIGIPKGGGEQAFVKTVPLPAGCCWPLEDDEK
jgi:hypothetical protein